MATVNPLAAERKTPCKSIYMAHLMLYSVARNSDNSCGTPTGSSTSDSTRWGSRVPLGHTPGGDVPGTEGMPGTLHRTPPGYPSAAAELRLREHRGLPLADHRLLSKQLHAAAVAAAWAGEVCCFDLAEQARTLLQERNLEGNRVSSQVTSHVRQVAVS